MSITVTPGAVTVQPPQFISSQKREKIKKKEMKERNMRYHYYYGCVQLLLWGMLHVHVCTYNYKIMDWYLPSLFLLFTNCMLYSVVPQPVLVAELDNV